MKVIQINLNHCRAAQDLLLQSVRECKADLAIISEPYKVEDNGDWVTNTSSKVAIWLCRRNGRSFLDVRKGSGFVRARIGEMWVYSCYLAPSLSKVDFRSALDTIAFDARRRHPTIIAGDFNSWAEEWGCPSTNIRGRDLLRAFATLDVVLLNEGTQETFNRAGAGSIIDLTFVSSPLARRSHWRIGDFCTASDHEAILCTVGIRPGPGPLNRAAKGYRQETLNAEQMSRCLADMHFVTEADVNTNADGIAASLEDACRAAEQDPWGGAYRLVVKRVNAGSRSPTDPETLSEIVRTLFPSGSAKDSTLHETGPKWEIRAITETEVAEAGRNLQNNKAPRPDAVPYNACLREGTFPRRWKVQKPLLLNKPGKPPGEASSYRPICLLDTVGKVFEKLISKRLNLAIDAAGGLSPSQFGFRKGKSTLDAIRTVTGIAAEAIRGKRWKGGTKKYCLLVALDIKNALDTANWTGIMQALRRQQIPEYLIKIIDSYLDERVLLFDTSDGPKEYNVTAGVPQGSVLAPCCGT
nr:uncharacterized protein LOC123002814 [Drosophila takahashii]